jgi:probable HAF family extracellular repeat protein
MLLAAVAAIVLGGSAASPARSAQTHWVITDLGTLGGKWSEALAINARGQVVGWSYRSDELRHAFLWQDGKMSRGKLPGGYMAVAINNRGLAVGLCLGREYAARACLWQNGKVRDLRILRHGDRGRALAVNDRGQVVGRTGVGPPSGKHHAFVWQDGRLTDLGGLRTGDWSAATAINDQGQIIGISKPTRVDPSHAVLWTLRP